MTGRGAHFPPPVTSHRGYDDALSIYGALELVPSRSGHATAGGYLKQPVARTKGGSEVNQSLTSRQAQGRFKIGTDAKALKGAKNPRGSK